MDNGQPLNRQKCFDARKESLEIKSGAECF